MFVDERCDSIMRQPDATLVSTLRPAARQRQAASAVACVSAVVFALSAPFAKTPLPAVPAFLPVYQSALVVFDVITSVLLLGQYRMLRSRALLFLAAGYVFCAWTAAAHLLSLPGLFAPSGLLAGGGQTTAWLYFLWHGFLSVFVLGYAVLKPREQALASGPVRRGIFASVGLGTLVAGVVIVLSMALHEFLPLMAGNVDAPAKIVIATFSWLSGIVALAMLWRRRPHTVLDLRLMEVLCVWTAD